MSQPASQPNPAEQLNEACQRVSQRLRGESTTRYGRGLVEELRGLEADGEVWASDVLDRFAEDGARRRMVAFERTAVGTVRLSRTGQQITCPAVFSVPVWSATGQRTGEYRTERWAQLAWGELDDLIEDLQGQRDVLASHVAALEEVQRLHARYPQTTRVSDACRLAGIDPDAFELPSERGA